MARDKEVKETTIHERIMKQLMLLPTDRARLRVMRYVMDRFEERQGTYQEPEVD